MKLQVSDNYEIAKRQFFGVCIIGISLISSLIIGIISNNLWLGGISWVLFLGGFVLGKLVERINKIKSNPKL